MRMIENLAYITKMYGKLRKKLSSRTLSQSDTVLVELIIYVFPLFFSFIPMNSVYFRDN